MGIIKYFRKKYWEAAIFRGGRRIPFTCDICHFSVPAETAIKHIRDCEKKSVNKILL